MAVTGQPGDPAMADRVWLGYHPRAMAPGVALLAVASLVLWTGRWYLDEVSDLADELGDWARFSLAWGVWPAVAAVFLYRTITFTYRLTDRSLLVDYGPLFKPVPAVPLSRVRSVVAGGGWLAGRLRVGWVEVRSDGRVVRLNGVHNPGAVADQIRAAVAVAGARPQVTA